MSTFYHQFNWLQCILKQHGGYCCTTSSDIIIPSKMAVAGLSLSKTKWDKLNTPAIRDKPHQPSKFKVEQINKA